MKKSLLFIILFFSGLMLQTTVSAQAVNLTDSITNPSFELDGDLSTTLTGWENPNTFQTQANTAFAYKSGTYYCEKWQASGNWTDIGVSQVLDVMPNGLYKLSAAGMSNGGGAYIYANEDSTEVDAAGNYDVYFAVDADTIKLGYYVVNGSNYVTVDNFTLIFYGDSYSSGLEALIDSANAIITAAVDLGDYTTQTYADLQAAVDSAQKIVDDGTSTTEDFAAGEVYMGDAIGVYYKVVNLVEYEATWPTDLPYEATFVIENPSFETGNVEGWENPDGLVTQTNTAFPNKAGTYYCEKWQSSASGGWTDIGISQTINYIPNGAYLLTAAGQAIDQSDNSYPGNAFFFANEDSVEVFEANSYSVIAVVTDNTLDIGFQLVGTSGNYLAIDNFQLQYLGEGLAIINVSESELTFDEVDSTHSFTVSGLNLSDSIITITVPTGFDIDIDTIAVDTSTGIADETIITVTMTDAAVFDGDITVTCGGFSETITVVEGTKEFFTPDPAISYYLKLEGFDKILGSADGEVTPKIYDYDGTTSQLFTIVESDTAGEYLILSEQGYLHRTGTNNWTMEYDTPSDSMLNANKYYHFTFTPLAEGCQLIQCVLAAAADNYVGPNAGETASGTSIYANKLTSNGEVTWRFIDPADIDFEVAESYVTMDDYQTTATVTIVGNNNVVENFTIAAPAAGFTVDTTKASWSGETITVTFDASAEMGDYITISSCGITKRVRVLGYLNSDTYTPLYSTSNIITDPYMTDQSLFYSWGTISTVTDTLLLYGGRSNLAILGGNSGSIDWKMDGVIKSDTYYRNSFVYKTVGGTMHLTYDDFQLDGVDADINIYLPGTDGEWVVFDTTIMSGSLDDASQAIYLNLYDPDNGGANGLATDLYVDNYQLYVIPLLVVEDSVKPTNTTTDEFTVAVQDVAGPVTITAPAGITVDPATLAADAGTVTVTVSFDNSADVEGYIELSDGVESDKIYVSATYVDDGSSIAIIDANDAVTAYINNGSINVDFGLENGGDVQFVVYNITGAVVSQQSVNLPAGNQHQILDAELTSGIYMLNIVKEGKVSSVKIVK